MVRVGQARAAKVRGRNRKERYELVGFVMARRLSVDRAGSCVPLFETDDREGGSPPGSESARSEPLAARLDFTHAWVLLHVAAEVGALQAGRGAAGSRSRSRRRRRSDTSCWRTARVTPLFVSAWLTASSMKSLRSKDRRRLSELLGDVGNDRPASAGSVPG